MIGLSAAIRAMQIRQRRRRHLATTGAVVGAIAIAVATWSIQSYLARRKLAAEVDEQLESARELDEVASRAARAGGELAVKAFAAFDTADRSAGEQLWQEVIARRALADRQYREASRYAELAFARDPTRADVRNQFADILLDRALLTEQLHDPAQRDELLERLALYDADSSRRARWSAPGRVVVHALPKSVIALDDGRELGIGNAERYLAPGSYVLSITSAGRVPVRAPIVVERAGDLVVDVTAPPRADQVPDGFVYIPPGEFLYGSASDEDRVAQLDTTPLRKRSTRAFLIGRAEVTFGDWMAYVDALPPDQRAARVPIAPTRLSGSLAVVPDGSGHWRIEIQPEGRRYEAGWGEPLVVTGRKRRAVQDWRRFPVVGISADDAAAYAAWLDHTGRVPGARLCTEVEWERAARGADGRGYPAGPVLEPDDANIDMTYGPGLGGLDEVGAHPASRSPFGLDDMAGNAFEWTLAEGGGYVVRGGGCLSDRKTSHLANRSAAGQNSRDATSACDCAPLRRGFADRSHGHARSRSTSGTHVGQRRYAEAAVEAGTVTSSAAAAELLAAFAAG